MTGFQTSANGSISRTASSKGCCTPERMTGNGASSAGLSKKPLVQHKLGHEQFETAEIPGGKAIMGTNTPGIPDDGESPLRKKQIKPFRISITTITNAEFAGFVRETGYVTEAERIGWSFVFWSEVPESIGATQGVPNLEWWRRVDGACWFAPRGPGSEEDCLPDYPVVHVSWHDAMDFAKWAGGTLPNEAQWEHAARGGLGDVPYPWGHEEPNDTDFTPCNIWQGKFPDNNTGLDGFVSTAPARSFEPNGYGLFNMSGNVWEWTSDSYRIRSLKKSVKARLKDMEGFMLLKGGSYLCHRSFCFRYRIAARSGNAPDGATTHQGFRVVWPVE